LRHSLGILIAIGLTCCAFGYQNPVIFADYSDPDVIRSGADYYLVASSFKCVPGLPILHSRDLVNWKILSYAVPRHSNDLWAPSIRRHGGWFWIYVGDPDRGIFMTRARDPRGPWSPLTLIKAAKGWIDPCPLWDDDGSMYLVHAWAKSRAGFNSVLSVNRMSADGLHVVDDGEVVFDGRERHPTIEGPKFYKRNGWYYIFAPAGGVKSGWQTVLRSKNVYGPYEDRVILEHGLHQGAWVDDSFIHFQDRGAYGRVVHLQPLRWINDWPEIDPCVECGGEAAAFGLPTSDEFNAPRLGLQWQWEGKRSYTLHDGKLRPNTPLLQKFPAPAFTVTTRVVAGNGGLIVTGAENATLDVGRGLNPSAAATAAALRAADGLRTRPTFLRVTVTPQAICRFSSSTDGKTFHRVGAPFVARAGHWIGAKVGIYGDADFDWFRVEPFTPKESASLVVAQDGSGDFTTIQAAVDAIPNDNADHHIILVRNGTYREKVMIATSHIALVGEDRDRTQIVFAELRKNWRKTHPDDWGAAVINIGRDVTDVTIANMTVRNDYGGDHDHQFAIRSFEGSTRIAILNANVIADGGDTVSLWNVDSGLTYYADSYFEGWVDFVCPRGWAYATNSRFFSHSETASIWHDGSAHQDSKFVIRHSSFDGVPNFALGRNHRDGQFYLLDVSFSANIADKPLYAVAQQPTPPRQWPERFYYSNAHRAGGDWAWFADDLPARDEDVDAVWTFGGRWDPRTIPPILPFASMPYPENGARLVDPAGVTLRWTPARNARADGLKPVLHLCTDAAASCRTGFSPSGPLQPGTTYYWRVDDGPVWSFTTDARTTRIALAGDSTMTEKSGYGNGLRSHISQDVAFLNAARGGRSSKSFRTEGHWAELLRHKPTHILIQFGHNDQPGKGLDRETTLEEYRANMARYVDEARAAGATPILVTPLTRRSFPSDLTPWAEATKSVAAEKNVQLIDLHAKSIELLERLGPAVAVAISPVKTDGTIDKTHLNAEGSALIGALVANELGYKAQLPEIKPAWSARMADSVIKRTPNPLLLDVTNNTPKWDYTQGLIALAMQKVAERTGDARYWNYAKAYYDGMVDADGTIHAYRIDEYSLDRINPGKPLFALWEKTHDEKYRKAIETLRRQLREHPRNADGGFWHKKRYPHQMWLDGLYMAAPFYAQYANVFHEPAAFDDVITQFVLMEKHARDEKSGLLVHGYDDSREQKWADRQTGRSSAFWGRAMGWYAMGLVETLDFVPLDHPRRGELVAILQRLAEAITRVQDPKSGVWWQVVDQPEREGNYLESSASSMFAFVLLKASRLGYIDKKYHEAGSRAYAGILKEFIDGDDITRAVAVVGLGGDPNSEGRYRDGSYQYYVTEKTRSNDPKAVGPFIFASLEMER
jgi:unsaturated rhamnogalacturonyl hydrolase